jgi:hypothetical protein
VGVGARTWSDSGATTNAKRGPEDLVVEQRAKRVNDPGGPSPSPEPQNPPLNHPPRPRSEVFTQLGNRVIETFYNRRRLRKHPLFGYLTPHETRQRFRNDQTLAA